MADNGRPRLFHERFDIEVGMDEAKQQFVNRINLLVFEDMSVGTLQTRLAARRISLHYLTKYVALTLGERMPNVYNPAVFVGDDFLRCLLVLEALYEALETVGLENELSDRIQTAIKASALDLGIDWQPPAFVRTGAPLLDESLVKEPLRWLEGTKYESVRKPFSKGLSHYLEAQNRLDRLADVITDMYEAVEALAKVVTGKDNDLSKNRELFIKNIQASDYYKQLLKDYIRYASEFRHAARLGRPRPSPSEPEVESFIYLTGLFIRLAIRTT